MLASPLLSLALHEWQNVVPEHGCVYPGTCTPPDTTFFRVANGPVPGQQWNDLGGFCGAFSIQHAALSAGAWWSVISPLMMTWLLLRVSGVAMLEKDIAERRPAYRDYIERTSAFLPAPPRRSGVPPAI